LKVATTLSLRKVTQVQLLDDVFYALFTRTSGACLAEGLEESSTPPLAPDLISGASRSGLTKFLVLTGSKMCGWQCSQNDGTRLLFRILLKHRAILEQFPTTSVSSQQYPHMQAVLSNHFSPSNAFTLLQGQEICLHPTVLSATDVPMHLHDCQTLVPEVWIIFVDVVRALLPTCIEVFLVILPQMLRNLERQLFHQWAKRDKRKPLFTESFAVLDDVGLTLLIRTPSF
jgi:hypothetical protein